jgi:VIT1/CCC1 family predicted Fe2+/Mn2+ transporter
LDPKIAIIVGLANLFADGISMAVGDYLSEKSEKDYIRYEKERELWEIEHMPEAEKFEVREIYKRKGLTGEKLEHLVEAITSNKEIWVDTMLHEELGIFEDDTNPLKSAVVTFLSFTIDSVHLCVPVSTVGSKSVFGIVSNNCGNVIFRWCIASGCYWRKVV